MSTQGHTLVSEGDVLNLKGALFLMLPPLLEQGFLSRSLVITGPNWA
jgi:hypothetical protein